MGARRVFMQIRSTDDQTTFSRETSGLPEATPPSVVDLNPDEVFDLDLRPVAKHLGDATLRMFAYNGSIPGPTLRVRQGSEVVVNVTNNIDIETTVHWHGLRLLNPYDGVPHETQAPIPPGGQYMHRLQFPDTGVFWYHPHMREDYAQEMGLYGNIIVVPEDPDFWPPVDREIVLTLDDVLVEEGTMAPFDPHGPTYTAMGRFGNVMLINGEKRQEIEVERGEVIRLSLTNTANTRVFKVAIPNHHLKVVGSDGGRYEREEWAEDVVLAPSERAIVDACFDRSGSFVLEHQTPGRSYRLVDIKVREDEAKGARSSFETLRTNPEMVAERERIARFMDAPPDKTLAFVAEMDFEEPAADAAPSYSCPMHPEVVSDGPGKCPKCGMKLMPIEPSPIRYACPMHPGVVSDTPGKCPECGMKLMPVESEIDLSSEEHGGHEDTQHGHDHGDAMADGVEWEDMMEEVNRGTTPQNMRWMLVDRDSGLTNAAIDWAFNTGDQVKIRLVNEMDSDHPMHHPFHVHGERFLVLARDREPEANLVWKDTVLVRTGQTIDILMDASNPGLWMAHCHIAEHAESGMMFSFRVGSKG
jgi:FtsP/CotA-like multicopper oxidase with cupredoxin domain